MSIVECINNYEQWEKFYELKEHNKAFDKNELHKIRKFIDDKKYEKYYILIKNNQFPENFPYKKCINKIGTDKKRIVYSFNEDENIVLKFIANKLYKYDNIFSKNCYSFRKNYGVKNAINRFKNNKDYSEKYCFKADISNYFNSINIEKLLDKCTFLKKEDNEIYEVFDKILREERVYDNDKIVREEHGAMAGIPCSPFFANVYLDDLDKYYEERRIDYYRYSDDILIFANTKEDMDVIIKEFRKQITDRDLEINEDKVMLTKPNETFEFLGFSYQNGKIDLSLSTKRKIKGKIKRKAEALRRWQRKKNLTSDKAAKGFINSMNYKFYGKGVKASEDSDFTWNRWFFPNLTVDDGLREIDKYMQQYIRYIITGRHYKGNYRITYEQMKDWGYKSLLNTYYKEKYVK